MKKKKIFIFEFVSGGGFNKESIPSSLFSEGYSMLKSIIEDFKKLNFEILTLLDKRIKFLSAYLKADFILFVDLDDNCIEKFEKTLLKSDCCFIIAPEFSNILYNLTEIAYKYKKQTYSIGLNGIKLGASKMNTYEFFKKSHVPTPETYVIPVYDGQFDLDFIHNKFNELNNSIIIKPEDGVGAESILHIDQEEQINKLFGNSKNVLDLSRKYILQRFIDGVDMSMSLIGVSKFNDVIPYILSINTQNVILCKNSIDSRYNGGMTPAENYDEIQSSLQPLIKKLNLSDFKGYFGIDFIKTPKAGFQFIEINPRLTTSYLGIRNIYKMNIFNLIVKPMKMGLEKMSIHPEYFSKYNRLDLQYIGQKSKEDIRNNLTFKILKKIPEMITPPIQLIETNSNNYSCFIATKTRDLRSSDYRVSQILKVLKKFEFIQLNREE